MEKVMKERKLQGMSSQDIEDNKDIDEFIYQALSHFQKFWIQMKV